MITQYLLKGKGGRLEVVMLDASKDADILLNYKKTLFSMELPNIDSLSNQLYDSFKRFINDNDISVGLMNGTTSGVLSYQWFSLNKDDYKTSEKKAALIDTLKQFPEAVKKYGLVR